MLDRASLKEQSPPQRAGLLENYAHKKTNVSQFEYPHSVDAFP